jgi:hypothetical protein
MVDSWVAQLDWRISSWSDGGSCVEVAFGPRCALREDAE